MSYTTIDPPFETDEVVTATRQDQLRQNVEFLATAPATHVTDDTPQSIPHDTWTKLNFTTIRLDRGSQWDISEMRMVAAEAGWYEGTANVEWEASEDGVRQLRLASYDGTTTAYHALRTVPGVDGETLGMGTAQQLGVDAGHFIWLEARQTSGGVLDVQQRVLQMAWRTL